MGIDISQDNPPISPEDPKYRALLARLQGNVLKPHGRDHAVHIFIRFHSQAEERVIRQWIADFTNRYITSAWRQYCEAREFKLNGISGRPFGNLFLTKVGYERIGHSPDRLDDPLFQSGMEQAGAGLNDPAPEDLEPGFVGRKIHAMVLLADEDPWRLLELRARVEASLRHLATVVAVEDGIALRDCRNKPVEQFGYRDGISQPLFFEEDVAAEYKRGGTDQWDPSAPLNLVLVPDPLAEAEDAFGSYFVFRKLEENVKGFKAREEELAQALGIDQSNPELAGALVVGRFEDGVPVLLRDTEHPAGEDPECPDPNTDPLLDFNNFSYLQAGSESKCPFQAHIRKTNPRGDSVALGATLEEERARRIARRGITYGERERGDDGRPTLEDQPETGTGLLFMCFQRSIQDQFAFMQRAWANNPGFARPGTGIDPVIGQQVRNHPGVQRWPSVWGDTDPGKQVAFDFGDFVTMKGGEFFFAPSIPFLRRLNGTVPGVEGDLKEFAAEGPHPST
jgi:Dyp-type peroxidase family